MTNRSDPGFLSYETRFKHPVIHARTFRQPTLNVGIMCECLIKSHGVAIACA
jgi:hypothetical protein